MKQIKLKLAANLIYMSCVVGLLKSLLYETLTTQKVLSTPTVLAAGLFTSLLIIFIGFKIGQGKNWARITFLVFFAIGLIPYLLNIASEFKLNLFIGVISIIQMGFQLYALIILFRGETANGELSSNGITARHQK